MLYGRRLPAFPPLGFGVPDRFGQVTRSSCPIGTDTTRIKACQNGGWFADRSITATLSFPVFDGFRARSNFDVAQANLRVAELQLQLQRETISLEVARARLTCPGPALLDACQPLLMEARQPLSLPNRSGDARAALDEGLQQQRGGADEDELGEEAFQLASLRFSRGLRTQLEVTDAQLALATAQSGEARATYDLYLATADLARALGRPIPYPPDRSSSVRRSESGS